MYSVPIWKTIISNSIYTYVAFYNNGIMGKSLWLPASVLANPMISHNWLTQFAMLNSTSTSSDFVYNGSHFMTYRYFFKSTWVFPNICGKSHISVVISIYMVNTTHVWVLPHMSVVFQIYMAFHMILNMNLILILFILK